MATSGYLGRADEVLKVAGHRIGTVELESALVSHPAVSEAAVMGKEDAVKGEVPVAFVALRSGFQPSEELRAELVKHISTTIGPIATPDAIVIVNKLPKTRSGKIMRRILKAVLVGAPIGDVSNARRRRFSRRHKATHTKKCASNSSRNRRVILLFFLFDFYSFKNFSYAISMRLSNET